VMARSISLFTGFRRIHAFGLDSVT
jgi:hypothetical protein